MSTFVSIIGKGRRDSTEKERRDSEPSYRYEQVEYEFGEHAIKTSCFCNAVIKSGKYNFSKVIILGTDSSTWAELLDEPSGEETPLYVELYCKPETVSSNKDALIEALKKRWKVPDVELVIHSANFGANEQEILNAYEKVILTISDDIVYDVTHGFRWMPMAFTSALQMRSALRGGQSLEILYGELNEKKTCPVRVLKSMWEERDLANRISLFFDKLEATPLAERLQEYWPSGAKALLTFSYHLQGNYILPLLLGKDGRGIGDPLRQLDNACKNDSDAVGEWPPWVMAVKEELQKMYRPLTGDRCCRRILALAELYAKRHFYGQALIAQEVALRFYDWESRANTAYPTWGDLKNAPDNLHKEVDTKYREKDRGKAHDKINKILVNRNTIAHGALASRGGESVPQPSNLNAQYTSQQDFLQKMFGK